MRLRLLGAYTGLRVSELVLGTANFGLRWGHGTDVEVARKLVEQYAEAGGNFLDTADVYQFGQSEEFLGEILTGQRDQFVVASKYTQGGNPSPGVLGTGNSRLAMVRSVEASLKRLRTDRIDLYWVHLDDGVTPMEEIMRGLEDLVSSGKILYTGLSDFPAWRIARGATIAEWRGWTRLAAIQFEHSLMQRTSEHELLAAGQALGLGMTSWSPLGGGILSGKYRRGEKGRLDALHGVAFQKEDSAQRTAILDTVLAIATELGVESAEVALAWVLAKGTFPIIGPRSALHFASYLSATQLALSTEHLQRLDSVSALPPIFPYSMIHSERTRRILSGGQLGRFPWPSRSAA